MDITSVQPIRPLEPAISTGGASRVAGFADVLNAAYTRVEASGAEASQAVESFLNGDRQDLHSVAMATQKAGLEFEMMLQVRNKIVNAYQEVMRMQL